MGSCPPNLKDFDLNGDGKISRPVFFIGGAEYKAYQAAVSLCKKQESNRHKEQQTQTRSDAQVRKVELTGDYASENWSNLLGELGDNAQGVLSDVYGQGGGVPAPGMPGAPPATDDTSNEQLEQLMTIAKVGAGVVVVAVVVVVLVQVLK